MEDDIKQSKPVVIIGPSDVYRFGLDVFISLIEDPIRPSVIKPLNKITKGPINRKKHWER